MTGLIIIGVLLVVVALAAPRYGTDSHTSDSWTTGRGGRSQPQARHQLRTDLGAAWTTATGAVGHRRAGARL
jgi:hypothetical protein